MIEDSRARGEKKWGESRRERAKKLSLISSRIFLGEGKPDEREEEGMKQRKKKKR